MRCSLVAEAAVEAVMVEVKETEVVALVAAEAAAVAMVVKAVVRVGCHLHQAGGGMPQEE